MNARDSFKSTTFPKASELSTKPKIKIPDLSAELYKDQKMFYQYDTSVLTPPLSTTSCFIKETTNSDPHLMRSTMYVLPNTSKFYENLNIPFGVSVTPFNFKSDSRRSIQNTFRCLQCLSYINNYWIIKNDKVICNICKYPNEILENIDEMLKYPTYEICSTKNTEYKSKNFVDSEYFEQCIYKHSAFIFVIDTSFQYIGDYIEELKNIVENETFKNLYKKVVIMTTYSIFGCNIDGSFVEYNLELSPFIPPNVFIETNKIDFKKVLDSLSVVKDENKKNHKKVYDVLLKISRYSIGSKACIFSSNITSLEEILNMSVHFFTGMLKYKNDLYKICCSESIFNVSIEVKTSNGIAKNAVYTDTEVQNITYVNISNMDCSSTVTYTFYIDEHITDSKGYIQFIINYSTHDGEYKCLILNQAYKISKFPYDVINSISFDTLFSCFCKYICKDVQNIKNCEEMICKFLKFYRSSCCKEVSISQFVLPDSAKLLPVLYQAMVKNNIFSIVNIRNDTRIQNLDNLLRFTVEQNLRFFYPRLFTLTDFYIDQDLTKIQYLRLSMSVIDSSEIYVLENGQKIFIFIGKSVDVNLKEALFKNEEEYAILMKLVDDINGTYGYELPIVVIEEGKSAGEIEFYSYMVEDSMNGICSYYDYVCELHFKVQKA